MNDLSGVAKTYSQQRSVVCARALGCMLLLSGCSGTDGEKHVNGDDHSFLPQVIDEQRLGSLDTATGIFSYTNVTGRLRPARDLGSLDDDDFGEESMLVATALVSADYTDLGLYRDHFGDSLYLNVNAAGDWSATMENGTFHTSKVLKVSHFTYADPADAAQLLGPKDYPAAVRWDTLEGKQVIGVRCGSAWCLVGGVNAMDGEDPMDDATAPVTARIRGWSDWKPNSANVRVDVIPVPGLRKHKKGKYRNDYRTQVATIKAATGDTAAVFLKFDGTWHVKYKNSVGEVVHNVPSAKYTRHREREVPGLARWDASPISPAPFSASDATAARGTKMNLGTLWIRCASGCCEADAFLPM